MSKWLTEQEPTFKDIRNRMSGFFNNVRNVQLRMNKYIHKQGYASFYQVVGNPFLSKEMGVSEDQILRDFESYLEICIGAVANYRLAIDPLPVILMEEDLCRRVGDLITEPYTAEFVDKYIGKENLEAFKTTEVYKDFCESLSSNEKQNEAVYYLIHYQYYDRDKMNDYEAQLHLFSFSDRVAMCLFTLSDRISYVFVDGVHWYHSNVKSNCNNGSVTIGLSYYADIFSGAKSDFNQCYYNVFLSRCLINGTYTYFEHNEELTESEIEWVGLVAAELSDLAGRIETKLLSLINGQ